MRVSDGSYLGYDVVRKLIRLLIDLVLHVVGVPRHDNICQKGQCARDGGHFVVRPSVLGRDRARVNTPLQAMNCFALVEHVENAGAKLGVAEIVAQEGVMTRTVRSCTTYKNV